MCYFHRAHARVFTLILNIAFLHFSSLWNCFVNIVVVWCLCCAWVEVNVHSARLWISLSLFSYYTSTRSLRFASQQSKMSFFLKHGIKHCYCIIQNQNWLHFRLRWEWRIMKLYLQLWLLPLHIFTQVVVIKFLKNWQNIGLFAMNMAAKKVFFILL